MSDVSNSSKPQPPEDLDGEALLEWFRIVAELETAGRLENVDRSILTVYVSLWATHRAAARQVLTNGSTHKIPGGYSQTTPDYDVMIKTSQQLRAMLKEMTLTPASRPKTKAPASEELEI